MNEGDYIVLTPGNFVEGGGLKVRSGKDKHYSADFPEQYLLAENDILVVMTDLIQSAPLLGGALIVPEDNRFLHNQRLGLVRTEGKEAIDRGFLYYLLNSPAYKAQVRASATGATVRHTAPTRIEHCHVTVPTDPGEQRAIAEILEWHDEGILQTARQLELFKESARQIYTEWFVRLRFPRRGIKSPTWPTQPLSSIANINTESLGRKFPWETLLYIDISSVSPGFIEQKAEYPVAEAPGRAKRLVAHGDIIWSCVRPNRRSHALVLNPEENLVVSTGFATIRATSVPWSYLYLTLTTDAFVAYLESHAQGAAYPAVTGRDFERAEVLVPPPDVLERFDVLAKPIFEQIENLKNQITQLRQARDLLLPRLISGQLRL